MAESSMSQHDCVAMAEPPMFDDDWVIQMEQIRRGGLDDPAMLLVPRPMVDLKPAAYIPQFLSLGPYHHSRLQKDIKSSCVRCKISRAEEYKGKTAAIVSKNLRPRELMMEENPMTMLIMESKALPMVEEYRDDNFDSIVKLMEEMHRNIEGFYRLEASPDDKYSQNFRVMMAIDSSFLLRSLLRLCSTNEEDRLSLDILKDDIIGTAPFQGCIRCDIMKLENQIPLFVLRKVFEHLKHAGVFEGRIQHFNKEMWNSCDGLHPFLDFAGQIEVNDELVEKEPHLMGCVHALVSQFLQMRIIRNDNKSLSLLQKLKAISLYLVAKIFPYSPNSIEREFVKTFTAEHLNQAGIKFKMLDKFPGNMRFEVDSATLCLPCIHVSEMETEVFLRNMVALEFNDTTRPNTVTRYIALMASLVSSTDDVRLFKRLGIIVSHTISDEIIANMWRDMCQPFFTGELEDEETIDPLFQVLTENYFRTKIKRILLGLFDYVSSWKFIAPLAGFLGLAMTAIQTYPVLLKLLRHEYVYAFHPQDVVLLS